MTVVIGQAPNATNPDTDRPLTGAGGQRLAELCGLSIDEFEDLFAPRNVLDYYPGSNGKGDAFPTGEASEAAETVKKELQGQRAVLLGRGVSKAFGHDRDEWFRWTETDGVITCTVPHPSGVNRWWNDAANEAEAARFWRGQTFRALLTGACDELWDGERPAVLLSGGTDSVTVLWSLLELGANPVCYTFHLEGRRHEDLQAAERECERLDLDHRVITIPRDLERLKRHVKECVEFAGSRKVYVQVVYCFRYLFPEVAETQAFAGQNADSSWGSMQKDIKKYHDDPEGFREVRKGRMEPTATEYYLVDELAGREGLDLRCPYRNRRFFAWMLRWSWRQLNAPHQKQLALDGYRREYEESGLYRRRDSMQIGSGVREWHDVLLSEDDFNVNDRSSVAALYRDVEEGAVR